MSETKFMDGLAYCPETGVFMHTRAKGGSAKKGSVAGRIDTHGYRQIRFLGKAVFAHRLAFLFVTGDMPRGGEEIDHINGDPLDNRWENLRIVSRSGNQQNKRVYKNNKSGVPGVTFCRNRWHTSIQGKYIGSYKTIFEAVCIRRSAERNLGFHPNHGRAV